MDYVWLCGRIGMVVHSSLIVVLWGGEAGRVRGERVRGRILLDLVMGSGKVAVKYVGCAKCAVLPTSLCEGMVLDTYFLGVNSPSGGG